jgi:hypothetical protein
MFGRKGRKTPLKREPLAKLEDLRDDCIALFINSGLTQEQVHAGGGPTPKTISRWLYKETMFPRLDTIRAFLLALECDLIAVPAPLAREMRTHDRAERLGLNVTTIPRMPRKVPRRRG